MVVESYQTLKIRKKEEAGGALGVSTQTLRQGRHKPVSNPTEASGRQGFNRTPHPWFNGAKTTPINSEQLRPLLPLLPLLAPLPPCSLAPLTTLPPLAPNQPLSQVFLDEADSGRLLHRAGLTRSAKALLASGHRLLGNPQSLRAIQDAPKFANWTSS